MGKWKQINDANWRIPYVGGWCEGYVEGAWGRATLPAKNKNGEWYTSGIYSSAIQAWEAVPVANKHYDLPPLGMTVPVYFSLGNVWQGHVAIRLDDGMVASSTQSGNPDDGRHNVGYIHPNINDMISMYGKYNGGCTYLGWADKQWGVEIVRYVPDITTKDVTTTEVVPFEAITQNDENMEKGKTKVTVKGVNGVKTIVTTITYSDGVESSRKIKSSEVTTKPIMQVTVIGTKEYSQDSQMDVENNKLLKQIVDLLQGLITKITNIFK